MLITAGALVSAVGLIVQKVGKPIVELLNEVKVLTKHDREQYLAILRLTTMSRDMPISERITAGRKYIKLGGKKIVCGWSAVKFKNTGQQNTTISFGTTFTAKPVVLIGQPFNGVICTVFNDSVTTTGFTVNVPSVGGTTLAYRKMAWIAIGDV